MKKTTVLLVNLGSPEHPDRKSVRRYLKQFLSDIRVVDFPRIIWLPILYGVILNIRPKKVAKSYQKIWGDGQQSPLVETCEIIARKLNNNEEYSVHLAMRYGKPSIQQALKNIGTVDELLIIPMFPQYSSATTASVFDAVHQYFSDKRLVPSLKFINNYHDNPFYIEALAKSVLTHWQKNPQSEKLIISFHGLPQRFVDTGDIYQQQCQNTAKLLADKLKLTDDQWLLAFQSRFGREPWLKPYLSETLTTLAKQNIKTIDIISPGFSADCLETLEELAIDAKQQFIQKGGESFYYIEALNTDENHLKMWRNIIDC